MLRLVWAPMRLCVQVCIVLEIDVRSGWVGGLVCTCSLVLLRQAACLVLSWQLVKLLLLAVSWCVH